MCNALEGEKNMWKYLEAVKSHKNIFILTFFQRLCLNLYFSIRTYQKLIIRDTRINSQTLFLIAHHGFHTVDGTWTYVMESGHISKGSFIKVLLFIYYFIPMC